MHPTLRVALHFRGTVITALSVAVAVGVFIGWLLFEPPTPKQPKVFCDQAHTIPYFPAEGVRRPKFL